MFELCWFQKMLIIWHDFLNLIDFQCRTKFINQNLDGILKEKRWREWYLVSQWMLLLTQVTFHVFSFQPKKIWTVVRSRFFRNLTTDPDLNLTVRDVFIYLFIVTVAVREDESGVRWKTWDRGYLYFISTLPLVHNCACTQLLSDRLSCKCHKLEEAN